MAMVKKEGEDKIYRKEDNDITPTITVNKNFRKIIKTLAPIVPEATFRLSENGLEMRKADPSNVMLADLHVPLSNDMFRSFQIPDGTAKKSKKDGKDGIKFSVDIEKLDEILKRLDYGDITMEITDELTVRKGSKVYKIALLGDLYETPEIPELKLTTEVELGADTLSEIVRDCYMADHIKFMADNGKLLVTASDDSDLIQYTNSFGKVNTNGDNAVASYSREYLDTIAQAKRLTSKNIIMRFAKDMPASFTWRIQNNGYKDSEEGTLEFLLAPRIEA
ncbi:MAG: hypothetical protein ACXQTR_00265 [Candidatus Methanospirareceae archaeon]